MIIDTQFFNRPDSLYLELKAHLSEIDSDILMEDGKKDNYPFSFLNTLQIQNEEPKF